MCSCLQLISQNQQQFIRMINEPVPPGSAAGGVLGGVAGGAAGQQSPQQLPPVAPGGEAGAQRQGVPYTTIQVTPEEKEAIERVNPSGYNIVVQ